MFFAVKLLRLYWKIPMLDLKQSFKMRNAFIAFIYYFGIYLNLQGYQHFNAYMEWNVQIVYIYKYSNEMV